jgi:hypothetical protein
MQTKRLSTNELHEYGFVAEILKIYNINKKPHLIEVYPDWVERGDPVIYLTPELHILPPACFKPDSGLPKGKFVGVRDTEIWVAIHGQKPAFEDMCSEFDNNTEL